jgi:hypothetical protein
VSREAEQSMNRRHRHQTPSPGTGSNGGADRVRKILPRYLKPTDMGDALPMMDMESTGRIVSPLDLGAVKWSPDRAVRGRHPTD